MFQFTLRRITIFPLAILIANFIGFAFAFATAPIVTSSDPYSLGTNKLPPVMPAYLDYLQNVFKIWDGQHRRKGRHSLRRSYSRTPIPFLSDRLYALESQEKQP